MAVEMTKGKKALFAAACFLSSIAIMGELGVLPFVYDLYGVFWDHPMAVNYIVSCAALWMMVGSLAATAYMRRMTKKSLMIIGTTVFAVGSIVPGFVPSLGVLCVCRSLMGIGEGVVNAVVMALIAAVFIDEEKRAQFMGWQNAASTIFSTIMSYVSGSLAAKVWYHGFWVNIPIILAIIACILFIPNFENVKAILESQPQVGDNGEKAGRKPLGKLFWIFLVSYGFFTLIYSIQSYFIDRKSVV